MQNKFVLKNSGLYGEQCYIGGEWVSAGSTIEVTNPSTGEVLGHIPKMGAAEARQAIDAAQQAFPAWRARLAKERSAMLYKWYELVIEHLDELAMILSTEQGKPLTEARGECVYGASFLQWFAEEAKRISGDTTPSFKPGSRVLVNKEPIGVFAAITPWNFPLAMITRKLAPGLAAGCTVVIKPAELTPFTAIALLKLAEKAGFPKGVINMVTGEADKIGKEFCDNDKVKKVTFTGSTRVGKLLLEQCAPTVKKVSLELGGNAPFIVFDDADLGLAVQGAIASKFRNSGQTCVCANRFYIQKGIYDKFKAMLVAETTKLKPADAFVEGATQGPLINEAALAKVEAHIADAVSNGAKIEAGGKRHELGGTFFQPTVLSGMTNAAQMTCEETFGPVAGLYSFETEEEVVSRANDTIYGLAAYFYTKDLGRAFRVSSALEYGMVGVNDGVISSEMAPFGGVKQSGLGREGTSYGIEEFLEVKYVMLAGLG